MDELVQGTGNLTPIEKARNRLGASLFAVCLTTTSFIFLLQDSVTDFKSKESILFRNHKHWADLRLRTTFLKGTITPVVRSGLVNLFRSICVSGTEPRKWHEAHADWLEFAEPCEGRAHDVGKQFQFMEEMDSRLEANMLGLDQAVNALAQIPVQGANPPNGRDLLSTLDSQLSAERALLLHESYSDPALVGIMQGWWLWPVQKLWLQEPRRLYQPDKRPSHKPINRERYGFAIPQIGIKRPQGLGELSSKMEVFEEAEIEDTGLLEATSLAEMEGIVDRAYLRAKAAHDGHSAMTSNLQFGGLSVSWLQALRLIIPAIALLFVLFVFYANKAERPSSKLVKNPESGKSQFWFPRLGQPTDPLASPRPFGDQWVARILWSLHLILPMTLAYSAVWMNFDFGDLFKRSIGENQTPIYSGFLFIVVWWATITAASSDLRNSPPTSWRYLFFGIAGSLFAFTCGGGIAIHLLGYPEMMGTPPSGSPITSWKWVFEPAYWMPGGIWLLLAVWPTKLAKFSIAVATLMTIGIAASFGRDLFGAWQTLWHSQLLVFR